MSVLCLQTSIFENEASIIFMILATIRKQLVSEANIAIMVVIYIGIITIIII